MSNCLRSTTHLTIVLEVSGFYKVCLNGELVIILMGCSKKHGLSFQAAITMA